MQFKHLFYMNFSCIVLYSSIFQSTNGKDFACPDNMWVASGMCQNNLGTCMTLHSKRVLKFFL